MATTKVLGTVTAVIGEAKAIAPDGTVRMLQVGDKVFTDEVITTSADGSVKIALEGGGGKSLECGNDATLALHESILGTAMAAEAPAKPAPATDVAALQAAIAAGADPTQVAEATAAGGAPGAGGAEGGGSHEPVVLEQANSSQVVSAGFTTQGGSFEFQTVAFEQLPLTETSPVVSVSVQVDVEQPGDGSSGVVVSGNAASLIEGTNGTEGGKLVNFVISLDRPFDQDVQVTYVIQPGTATTPQDYFDGPLTATVTIPAGTTQVTVPIFIVEDHIVEGDENFQIVLTDAVNATINPAASTVVVTIIDDDFPPVANPDTNWVQEDVTQVASGNVLQSGTHSGAPSGAFADAADTDLEELTVINPGTYPGTYGTLVLNADGSYTYTLDNSNPEVQALDDGETLTDTFNYSVTDGYNEPGSSTLTISIFGTNDGPEIKVQVGEDPFGTAAEGTVYESALTIGSNPESDGEFVTGSFRVSDPDGLDDIESVTINGQTVPIGSLVGATFEGDAGTLTITSYENGIAYFRYELERAVTDGEGPETDVFTLTTSDGDNESDPVTITINILDDAPSIEVTGGDEVVEGGIITGAWRSASGADAPASIKVVVDGIEYDLGNDIDTGKGTLKVDSNGTWTFAAANDLDQNTAQEVSFRVKITDTDGDEDESSHTIRIVDGAGPAVSGGETITVNEAALAFGTNPASLAEEGTSTLTFTSGSDAIASIVFGSTANITLNGWDEGQTITWTPSEDGRTLTGSVGSMDVIRLDLSGATEVPAGGSTGVVTVTATLLNGFLHQNSPDADDLTISGIEVVGLDTDGDTATFTFTGITVIDDAPTFPIINDGADGDSVVSISTPNPATDTTYFGQFADWKFGADLAQGVPTISNVTGSGNVIINTAESTPEKLVLDLKDSAGNLVAKLTLNADGTDSIQVFHRAPTFDTDVLLTGDVTASGPELTKYIQSSISGLTVTVTASDGDSNPYEGSPVVNNKNDDEVNPSNQGWAVADNQIDEGESITFSFSTNVERFSFVADGFTGNPSDSTNDADSLADVGLIIRVYYDQGKTIYQDFQVTVNEGDSVEVANLPGFGNNGQYTSFYGVTVLSDTTQQDNNDGFRLNHVTISKVSENPPPDLDYSFTVNITDNDGDTTSQSFSVHLDGDPSGGLVVEAIAGTSGQDTLTGTGANDILIGGGGNDTLTGGGGSDTFVYNSVGDKEDTITDFKVGALDDGGDVLDINAVLPDAVGQATQDTDLAGYVVLEALGPSTVAVKVDADGGGDNFQTLVILQLTSSTGVTLQQLLDNNQIIT